MRTLMFVKPPPDASSDELECDWNTELRQESDQDGRQWKQYWVVWCITHDSNACANPPLDESIENI